MFIFSILNKFAFYNQLTPHIPKHLQLLGVIFFEKIVLVVKINILKIKLVHTEVCIIFIREKFKPLKRQKELWVGLRKCVLCVLSKVKEN